MSAAEEATAAGTAASWWFISADELPRGAQVEVARLGAPRLGDQVVEPHGCRQSTPLTGSGQYHFTRLPTLVLSSGPSGLYDRSRWRRSVSRTSPSCSPAAWPRSTTSRSTSRDGEFLVLVGPSGCGKTTLLRMIAGLEEVTDGAISIDGTDVTDLAPRRRDIAMVFQSYALYPHMSVRQNLAYGLKVRRTPKDQIATQGRRGGEAPRPRGPARPAAGAALRRPAAARRDGPRDRARAEGVPDGRAALEPRREAPRRHARVAAAAPPPARDHDRLRHARPDRGDDARAARRGDARRAHPPGRRAAARSTSSRATCSWPPSSARRR